LTNRPALSASNIQEIVSSGRGIEDPRALPFLLAAGIVSGIFTIS
jgi:hypothetical protein